MTAIRCLASACEILVKLGYMKVDDLDKLKGYEEIEKFLDSISREITLQQNHEQ